MMCYLDLCTSVSTIFLSQIQCQLTSRTILKISYVKNIKMKPPVALFKKQIMKLYLFLKTNSQVKAYQRSCMLLA